LLPKAVSNVTLHILENSILSYDLILGRDFLTDNNISFIYTPLSKELENRIQLFSEIATIDVVEPTSDETVNILNDITIDFDSNVKQQLINVFEQVENMNIPLKDDNYAVKVRLKDESTFAYSPRRFAYNEKLQIREITDDLLSKNIIKVSTSSYCARVVPVKKKNGTLRLCVDLHPLNERVMKQNYPFPIIEDCLAYLGNKSIFTLLDLKDGFHQIKIHPDHIKYFSLETSNGQFKHYNFQLNI